MADKPNQDGAPAPTPEQEVRRLYEEAETRVARAAERVVSRDSFGELLAMVTENVVALTRIGNEAMDLVLRNLRVEELRDELGSSQNGTARSRSGGGSRSSAASSRSGGTRRSSGSS
jgi:hypothetical protein